MFMIFGFLVGGRVLPRDDSEEGDHMSGTELQKKRDAYAMIGMMGVAVGKGSEQVKYHE
jgi:hypothetical protein